MYMSFNSVLYIHYRNCCIIVKFCPK